MQPDQFLLCQILLRGESTKSVLSTNQQSNKRVAERSSALSYSFSQHGNCNSQTCSQSRNAACDRFLPFCSAHAQRREVECVCPTPAAHLWIASSRDCSISTLTEIWATSHPHARRKTAAASSTSNYWYATGGQIMIRLRCGADFTRRVSRLPGQSQVVSEKINRQS